MRAVNDAQISLSPGFRWGITVLPGQTITLEHVLDQTCITYPETYVREISGTELKAILEDVADNLFNPDPYYHQGGDMAAEYLESNKTVDIAKVNVPQLVNINGGASYQLAQALHQAIPKITDKSVKWLVNENGQGHAFLGR